MESRRVQRLLQNVILSAIGKEQFFWSFIVATILFGTSQLKKCVLELGGSDPFIACEDANIEKASSGAVKGGFINNGQSSIATKRFVVVKDIANEFIEKFVQKTEKLKVGDPLSEDTDLGPVVNASGLKTMDFQVKDSVKDGAEILTGGEQIKSKG